MNTECIPVQMEFQGLGRRRVEADFAGGHVTSDGGALLLRELDLRLGLCRRFAQCFTDHRDRRFVVSRFSGNWTIADFSKRLQLVVAAGSMVRFLRHRRSINPMSCLGA